MTTSQNFPADHPASDHNSMKNPHFTVDVDASTPVVTTPSDDKFTPDNAPLPPSVALLPDGVNQIKALRVFRSIGYGLLLLSMVDLLYIVFPPEFTKPIWEYQTIGDLVRLIPVPMLAFMLVFYGEAIGRKKIERPIVTWLSWSTLIFGIFCILMIPLTVVNTLRIGQYNNEQINTQVTQQKLQLDQTKTQIEKATPEQVKSLIPVPDQKNANRPNISENPQEAKNQVLTNIQSAQKDADAQAVAAQKNVQRNLLKNSSKIILEALIGGCLFLYTWMVTGWARRRQADAYEDSENLSVKGSSKTKKAARRRRNA